MIMRPFSEPEERALAALWDVGGAGFLDITRRRPSTFKRLSHLGLVEMRSQARQTRARLTASGRYYAELVAGRHIEISGSPEIVVTLPELQFIMGG